MRKSHFNTPQLGNSFKRGNTTWLLGGICRFPIVLLYRFQFETLVGYKHRQKRILLKFKVSIAITTYSSYV